jgi:uncharacterized MAPEG superfamily protein
VPYTVHASPPLQGFRGYDLRNPRATTADAIAKSGGGVGDAIARCTNAHYNQLEGFPVFAGAVLAARAAGVDPSTVKALAWGVIALRAAYNYLYITGSSGAKARARGLTFLALLGLCFLLYALAAAHATD